MNKVTRVNDNSKGHLCCSASIDLTVGCANRCVSCYGIKASRQGKSFFKDEPIIKEYDNDLLKKDLKRYLKNNTQYIRLGKFSDPWYSPIRGRAIQTLQAATSEGSKIVFISKSITEDQELLKALKEGGHTLHVSLGMISDVAPVEAARKTVYNWYKRNGANVKLRIVADVTKEMSFLYRGYSNDEVIVTPMRFNSKEDAYFYSAKLENYTYLNGYYRPNLYHSSWCYTNICGEVNDKLYCCECLVK